MPTPLIAPTPGAAGPESGASLSTAVIEEVSIEADRVVYRFGGDGAPFWKVGYVAEAIPHGGDAPIPVPGRAILQVDVMGTAAAPPVGTPVHDRGTPLPGPPGSVVTELFLLVGRGEGAVTQSYIGLSTSPAPFEVTTLDDPPRLVVAVDRP